jgi:TRAP-type mannitol/chloroaromatic compound transport system permease small subunit
MLFRCINFFDQIARICAWPGKVAGWLCLAIIGLSITSILAGIFHWYEFLRWENPIFLFGNTLNVISIGELQWHCFAAIALLGGVYTQSQNNHVRVDIFYSKFSKRTKLLVDTVGDSIFLIPFCIYLGLNALGLVEFSFMTNEASCEDGLTHRWLVKSILPAAMFLLATQSGCKCISRILRIIGITKGLIPAYGEEDSHA